MQLDPAALRVIEAVARHGTLTRAGAALGLSQPAISYQLRRAEENLGLVLFQRSRAGCRPSPAGEVLLRAAQVLAKWPGYVFGRHDEPFSAVLESFGGERTDAAGEMQVRETRRIDPATGLIVSRVRRERIVIPAGESVITTRTTMTTISAR